jgi:hypothetical protein
MDTKLCPRTGEVPEFPGAFGGDRVSLEGLEEATHILQAAIDEGIS